MPKRGDRHKFDPAIFETNPLAGHSPEEAYSVLRWGNPAREKFSVEAPEPMVAMGELAKLVILGLEDAEFPDNGKSPFLAVGTRSNLLYIVPRIGRRPVTVASGPFEPVGRLRQIDYYSDKGGEPAYYYHKHEKPLPMLLIGPRGVGLVLPARFKGGRSYAVAEGGIVG